MGIVGDHARRVFGDELKLIRNESMREFVVACFDKLCPDSFWVRPAAKGNRYHPQVSCDDGGLVRHTKYATWWGSQIMRSEDTENPQAPDNSTAHNDEVIAALIMHDVLKDGDPTLAHLPERQGDTGRRLIGGCHGVDMANAIIQRVCNGQLPSEEYARMVTAISAHMGVWTLPIEHRPSMIQDPEYRFVAMLVHRADYAASRKADAVMGSIMQFKCSTPQRSASEPSPANATAGAAVTA